MNKLIVLLLLNLAFTARIRADIKNLEQSYSEEKIEQYEVNTEPFGRYYVPDDGHEMEEYDIPDYYDDEVDE